jgi:hypothetical protein
MAWRPSEPAAGIFPESLGVKRCTVLVVEIRIGRLYLSTQGSRQPEFQEFEEILMRHGEKISTASGALVLHGAALVFTECLPANVGCTC